MLPKYRGSAPIQRAVLDGEKVSGVTTMLMNEGMDTGDILLMKEVPIAEDDTSERALIWLQGESDDSKGFSYYSDALKGLWHRCKALGFTKFLIIRVGYWGNPAIADVMQAQEQFCAETPDAFILTRAASYLPFLGQPENWLGEVGEEFSNGRDSYFGFTNQHINQKGFETVARYALPNLIRILWEQKDPILEPEQVSALRRS